MHTGVGAVRGFGCRSSLRGRDHWKRKEEESEEQDWGRECPCFISLDGDSRSVGTWQLLYHYFSLTPILLD